MSNPFYTHGQEFPDGTLGRGIVVDVEFEKIERAFDTMVGTGFTTPLVVVDAVLLTQATNLGQVRAEIAAAMIGGGAPGDIPADDLGIGAGLALQTLRVNAAGTGLEFAVTNHDRFNQSIGVI